MVRSVSPVERSELEHQLAFMALTDEDHVLLQALRPLFEQHADRLVGHFYRHLLSFEPTRNLLRDPDVKQRLLVKQRAYLRSLAGSPLDASYIEERLRIGQAHERVGLGPEWYLGAYSLYFSLLLPLIHEQYAADPMRCERTVTALVKVLLLDAQIAMKAYIAAREDQLEFLNRELQAASRSLERQVQSTGEALRATRRRARAAEELASTATLVAGLAHEIGTPMNVIHGHTELLESAVTDPKGRSRLRIIREQIERISKIIRTLLNVARANEPNPAPLRLDMVVEKTLSFVAEQLGRRGIRVERNFEPLPAIRADSDRMEQLFLNLFLNAADAMPEGGVLGIDIQLLEGGRVEIRVRDTGKGMSEEQLARIFEPFFTTKPAGQGSGLGLVVAKGIVNDHRGDLEVWSEHGKGTEFRIQLPVDF
jgi:signal transduction histidine kinase